MGKEQKKAKQPFDMSETLRKLECLEEGPCSVVFDIKKFFNKTKRPSGAPTNFTPFTAMTSEQHEQAVKLLKDLRAAEESRWSTVKGWFYGLMKTYGMIILGVPRYKRIVSNSIAKKKREDTHKINQMLGAQAVDTINDMLKQPEQGEAAFTKDSQDVVELIADLVQEKNPKKRSVIKKKIAKITEANKKSRDEELLQSYAEDHPHLKPFIKKKLEASKAKKSKNKTKKTTSRSKK